MSFVPSLDDMDDDALPPSAIHVADAAYAPPLPRAAPKVPAKARFVLPRLHATNCQPGNTLYLQVLGKWSHTMVVPPGYKPARCAPHTCPTLLGLARCESAAVLVAVRSRASCPASRKRI